jgi:CBS-domain-containing membrane protein
MRARDIMNRPVYSVRTTDTIEDIAALLAGKKITAAPVIDEAGELVGVVSEGDLLWPGCPKTLPLTRGAAPAPSTRGPRSPRTSCPATRSPRGRTPTSPTSPS